MSESGMAATLASLLFFALAVTHLGAQERVRVAVGDRVRAETEGRIIVGLVREVGSQSLSLEVVEQSEPVTLAFGSMDELELFRGGRRATRRGAIVGAVALGILGAVAMNQIATGEDNDAAKTFGATVGGGVIYGLIGAIPGALIGFLFHVEDWEQVPLSPQLGASGGGRRGLSVGVSISPGIW